MNIEQLNSIQQNIRLNRLNENSGGETVKNGPVTNGQNGSKFSELLTNALNGVNDTVLYSDQLSTQAIIDPDSVDVHDVTIAMSKANMAVSLTKQVVDGALKAYKEIINLR